MRKWFPIGFFGLLVAVTLAAGTSESPLTWGAHAYAFLPRVALLAPLLILVACLAPAIALGAGKMVLATGRVAGSTWASFLVALAAGGVFYVFRGGYQFLGDGQLWVELIQLGKSFQHFEPMSSAMVQSTARLLAPASPGRAAGLLSVFLGVIWLVATAALCRSLWPEARSRGVAWLLLLLNPTLLFWFGYVESYPTVHVLQVLFALACIGALRGRLPRLVPALLLGVAIASHLLALLWGVALFVNECSGVDRRRGVIRALALWALSVGVAAALTVAVGGSLKEIGSLLGGERGVAGITGGWMFSWQHAVDVANQLFLLLAPTTVLVAAAVSRGADVRRLWQDDLFRLAGSLLLGPLVVLAAVPPLIGGARDWDLYAALTLPAILMSVRLWFLAAPGSVMAAASLQEAGRAMALALVVTAGWLFTNLHEPTSARRFEVLQRPDGTFTPWAQAHAAEASAVYYRDKNPERELDAWMRAVAANPHNARYTTSVANTAIKLNRLEQACEMYRRSLELGQEDWHIFHNLTLCGFRLGDLAAAEVNANELVARWPDDPRSFLVRCEARLRLQKPDSALADAEHAVAMSPRDPQAHYFTALALLALHRRDEARAAIDRVLQIAPQHEAARRLLATRF